MLRDPEADVGAAGEDRGGRTPGERPRETGRGDRRDVAAAGSLDAQFPGHPDRVEPFAQFALVRLVRGIFVHAARRGQDRAITRAAAEVAGQRLTDGPVIRVALAAIQREQRHDESRRAEAALGAVALDHGALHGMQLACGGLQAFDGEQRLAVERRQEPDAGIHRPVTDARACGFRQHDGAGAAVALGAAFLGAGPAEAFAQVLEERRGRGAAGDGVDVAVQQEADRTCAVQGVS